MKKKDIFVRNRKYPDAKTIFKIEVKDINSIKDSCLYVLDTNALLVPYKTSSHGLNEIEKVYADLIKNNQLYIPGQVAREFADNRPEHIKQIFQQINRLKEGIKPPKISSSPILEDLPEFKKIQSFENQISQLRENYFKDINKLLEHIKSWKWNDPVSLVYNKLFLGDVIHDIKVKEDEFEKELDERYIYDIPPGYKDGSKSDKGIGDLMIWYTILELGDSLKKDIIFISGDEKSDWYHRSEGQSLYPRYELVSEFYEKSNGHTFNIMKLSDLMGLKGVDSEIINEIKVSESMSKEQLKKHRIGTYFKSEAAIKAHYLHKFGNPSFYSNSDFPDFKIKEKDKTIGIEIIRLETHDFNIKEIILEKYQQANEYISANDLDHIELIVLSESKIQLEEHKSILESIRKDFFNDNQELSLIIGYIDESFKFIEIKIN